MKTRRFGRDLWVSWSGMLMVLIVWQLIALLEFIHPTIFPGPLAVAQAAWRQIPVSQVLLHTRSSLARIIGGFFLGATLGIVIGVTSGWYRWLRSVVRAPIELLRPIPPLAWIPLAIVWFGLGEPSKVFVIFLGAFFPVVTNTYKGLIGIDPDLLRAAQTLGLRGWRLLLRVALPASFPDIATGIRVGWSLSFGALVAAELIAADRGLGFMIMHARELGQIGVIIYGIILIGLVNLLTDFLIQELLFKRHLGWHFRNVIRNT
jgi:ABC-type nitrate/sulfonate/bicarbonate transport system permease component